MKMNGPINTGTVIKKKGFLLVFEEANTLFCDKIGRTKGRRQEEPPMQKDEEIPNHGK